MMERSKRRQYPDGKIKAGAHLRCFLPVASPYVMIYTACDGRTDNAVLLQSLTVIHKTTLEVILEITRNL